MHAADVFSAIVAGAMIAIATWIGFAVIPIGWM